MGRVITPWEFFRARLARVADAARQASAAITALEVSINVVRLELEEAKRSIRRGRLAKRKRKPARGRRRRVRDAEEAQG